MAQSLATWQNSGNQKKSSVLHKSSIEKLYLIMHQIRHFTKFMLVENLTQHTAQNKLT
jgi:hypothetical protein